MGAPYHFFTATPRGEMLQRLLDDAEALQETAVQAVPRALYDFATAAVAVVAMLRLQPGLTALALGVVLLAALPGKWVGESRRRTSAQTRENQARLYQQAQERLEAVRLVKTFTAEEREAARFRRMQETWARLQLKAFLIGQSYLNVPRILESLAPMLIYLVGGYMVFGGRLRMGELVALAGYLPLVAAPVRSFSTTWLAFKEAAPRLEAALAWMDDLPQEAGRDLPRGAVALDGDIEFDHVTFTYPGAAQPVLDRVSFRIPAGARAALVGPSGAGKSTVLALLARLYEPQAGQIRVGGRPLASMHPDDLRAAMAVVTQETFLLNESIRLNLTFGLGCFVTDAELADVLRAVRLDDVVAGLPQGLDTVLANGACACPAASASGWPWPGPSCGGLPCCCWTRPHPPWTTRTRRRSRRPSSRWRRGGPA
jgi:ABC-type multidrug transport system fused ATPase/permease subunit